jgi:hypothetical protein
MRRATGASFIAGSGGITRHNLLSGIDERIILRLNRRINPAATGICIPRSE